MQEKLTSPTTVRTILQSLDFHPSKVLGQNFLVDRNTLDILLRAAALDTNDDVIEIGPGLGTVTRELLDQCRTVTAIEKDPRLCEYLRETLGNRPNLDLRCADALDLDLRGLAGTGHAILVANLPYVAGSRILMEFAQAPVPPERMVVTVQKEVGNRLTAAPSTADYGLLSLWLQLIYKTELVHTVPPTCFWPRPSIYSAIVKLVRHAPAELLPHATSDALRAVSRYAFMHRRKQLAKLLNQIVHTPRHSTEAWQAILRDCGLEPHARPEALGPADWKHLTTTALSECRLSH